MKRQLVGWKKIFANCTFNRGLILIMFNKQKITSKGKTQETQLI